LNDEDRAPPDRYALDGRPRDEYPWDDFDADWYADRYFGDLRGDDREILETVRDFFTAADLPSPVCEAEGIDVGPGPNLYPALAMLPLCGTITLWEHAPPNVRWLARELPSYGRRWDPFWAVLARHQLYRAVGDPRAALAARAIVHHGSVLDLPERRWDVGTMLFVAESFSPRPADFEAAISSFVRSLKPSAPFAIGLMENSEGYQVGARRFPAVAVDAEDVRDSLEPATAGLRVSRIGATSPPIRAGYSGMLLATGLARRR